MTPHRTGGRRGGNLEIDRQIAGLGRTRSERRLRFSIESNDERKLNRVNAIIDKLIENDQWETLRAWKRGELTVGDMIEADRHDATNKSLGRVKQHARLWDVGADVGAVSRALAKVKGGHTRARYVSAFKALQRKADRWLPAAATVGDLQYVDWEQLAGEWGASPADWMQLRRGLSRFLTLHLGDKFDPFARAVRQAIPIKKVKKRRPKISIERFRAIIAAAEANGAPHAAAAFWVLALTGMRVGEYLRCTPAHLDRSTHTLEVPGTKTETSEGVLEIDPRWWGYLELAIPPRIRYKALHNHWMAACVAAGAGELVSTGKTKRVRVNAHPGPFRTGEQPRYELVPVTRYRGAWIHDLRHCHGQWAVNAGVQESKIQASLRHADAAMTRDYVLQHATRDVSSALADAILGKPNERKGPGRSPGRSVGGSGRLRGGRWA